MPALFGGLLIGMSLGLLGSGGSILTVPVLVYGLGHVERVAVAESLAIVGAIALLGALPYMHARRIVWREVLLFGVPGMVGTWFGAAASQFVAGYVQLLAFAVVMLVAAAMMLRRFSAAQASQRALPLAVVEGTVVGLITGFVGVGGGFLIVPSLVMLRGLSMHHAIGTSLLIISLKSFVGFHGYRHVLQAESLQVDWLAVGLITALGAIGAFAGMRLGSRIDGARLQRGFAVLLVVLSLTIIYQEVSPLLEVVR